MSIEAKQVYEWVKTGHWSLREFKDWLAEAEKQEPVAWMQEGQPEVYVKEEKDERCGYVIPLYTHPQPKSEWVGLTDEDDIDWDGTGNLKQLVEAVEAKLKDKNGF